MMPTPDAFAGLRAWFEAALAQPTSNRQHWLAVHCTDAALRSRVEALLVQENQPSDGILDQIHAHFANADVQADAVLRPDWSGRVLGDYQLGPCIGEGGMSVVYRARARHGAPTSDVAVKVLRFGLHEADRQKAFQRERDALAKLDHPNIARLIDGGIAQGIPYLVIDHIDGIPLTDYARQHALDLRARLHLFATMCRAVEAAHRLLIVHRDLKPSNVLVTRDGQVKLLDFGIAKLLDDDAVATRTAHVALTPDYAAPEQFSNAPISTATDVFALGVILHELLTGVRPERGWTTRPSVIVGRIADTDLPAGLLPRPLRANLAGDLDNVILKAIEQDPERRYGDAGRLADDIEHHLAGRPVSAHPPSRWYRTRKFVQRHRGAVSLSASLALGLLVSLGIAVQQGHEAAVQARAAEAATAEARRESGRANAVRDFVLGMFKSAQAQLPEGQRPTPQQLVQAAAEKLESGSTLDAATRASLYVAYADISATQSAHDDAANAYARAAELIADQPSLRRDWLAATLDRAEALNNAGRTSAAVALAEPLITELRTRDDLVAVEGLAAWTDILLSAARFDEAIATVDDMAQRSARLSTPDASDARFRTLMPGWVRANAGRNKAAEGPLERALDTWRRSRTPKDAEFAGGLATLSFVKHGLGRFDEARALLDESLTLSRTIFKAPHERLGGLLESLSVIELGRGDLVAAATHVAEAQAMFTALFGPTHPKVLSARLTSATIDWERIGVTHAIAEYRDIAELCATSKQDERNPDCARTWQNLSNALLHSNQPDEALTANARSVALRAKIFGEQHGEYAIALAGRGVILLTLKRYLEALSAFDRALAIQQHNGTAENINAATILRNRSVALRHLHRHDEALSTLDAAAAIFERFAASDVAQRADIRGLRALILADDGQNKSARREAQQALQLDPTLSKCATGDRDPIRALAVVPR
ncbi:MAG TPA: serine/threonine-protein kinase [Pseudomonadota bacterium]|nr:serine/threonine protein kinase [Xanthomonadales bacterium]HQW82339.1 serine/threonine-protein kinase [Pseudomonadota bacterium]